ncbi:MAG: AsmA family protein, partial [Acidiferrobacterales bacterium]
MRTAKIVGWTAVALLALLVVLVVILLSLDLSTYRDPLQSGISAAAGRPVRLHGDMSMRLSLHPTIVVEDATVANPSWASRPNFARVGRVEVQLALLPLVRGDVQILSLNLKGLDVLLEGEPDGRNNWTFGKDTKDAGVPPLPLVESLACEQCVLAYRVDATREERIEIAAAAGVLAPEEPLQLLASGTYQDIPFKLTLLGGAPLDFLTAKAPWPIEVKLRAAGATLSAAGDLIRKKDASLEVT